MSSIHKISINRFLSYLFNIYLIMLVFDPMRESLGLGALNTLFSLIRDFVIISLCFITIFYVKNKKISIFLLFWYLSLNVLFLLSFFSGENEIQILKSIYGLLRSFLLILVILNLKKIYIYKISSLIKFYIIITLINFFVTFYIFFFMNYLIVERSFVNRVCIGNPSLQSIIYISCFLLTFYYQPFNSKIKNLLISLLLLFAAILTVTTTAFVGIIVIMLITIKERKYRLFWFFSILIGGFIIYYFVNIFHINTEIFTNLMEAKIKELLGKINDIFGTNFEANTGYQSLSLRDKEITRFLTNRKNDSFFFGDGIFSMINPEKYMIENTYVALFRDFGFFGILNFSLFLLYFGIIGINNFLRKQKYGILLSISIIAAYSYTLYIFAGTSILVQFFLLFYFTFRLDKRNW